MIKKIHLILILIVIALSACQTPVVEQPTSLEGEPFAIYLLSDVQITGPDVKKYDLKDLPLAELPVIGTDDIVSYDWSYHGINLTEEAYLRLLALFMGGLPSSGVPFVLLAYEQPIYAGAFWSPLSSLSFDGVAIMQPLDPAGQTLYINLGYPSEDYFTGEDPRGDSRIQQALENAGILR